MKLLPLAFLLGCNSYALTMPLTTGEVQVECVTRFNSTNLESMKLYHKTNTSREKFADRIYSEIGFTETIYYSGKQDLLPFTLKENDGTRVSSVFDQCYDIYKANRGP